MHDLAYYFRGLLIFRYFFCIIIANYICNINIDMHMLIEVWKKNTSNMPKIWHEMKRRNSLLYSGIILNRRQVLDSINGVLLKVKILRDQTKKNLRWCMNVKK